MRRMISTSLLTRFDPIESALSETTPPCGNGRGIFPPFVSASVPFRQYSLPLWNRNQFVFAWSNFLKNPVLSA